MHLRILYSCFLIWIRHSAVSSANEECIDQLSYCADLETYCNDPESGYQEFTLQYCPSTCRVCPEDIDPDGLCTTDNGGCEHVCVVEQKVTRKCKCYPGYTLKSDGINCTDINECTGEANVCGLTKVCRNVAGSFLCERVACPKRSQVAYMGRTECCEKEPDDAPCGLQGTETARIIGGNVSRAGQWPWQVFIFINQSILCGGTVLHSNWVITAGHCFTDYGPTTVMELYFGATELNQLDLKRIQKRSVKRHVIYPNWKSKKFHINDVALIELDEPLTFDQWVKPVCLPNGEKPKVGTICFAAGWGLTDEFETKPSNMLQHVDLPIVDPIKCTASYRNEEQTVNSTYNICAGYDEGGKDTCRGDSGGPLVCQRCNSCGWYLAGVTSFGAGCAQRGFYGVYSNVHYFEEWISNEIGIPFTNEKSCTGPHLTQWSRWSECTKSCGTGGRRTSTRQCLDKGQPSTSCTGDLEKTEKCPAKACPKFGPFGKWSVCSKTCGGGNRTQFRVCKNGKLGDDGCPADEASRREACNSHECPYWDEWSSWTQCSRTCGGGIEERERKCINGNPSDEGCVGDEKAERICADETCPGWTDWSVWTACSETCGGGTQTSTRTCTGGGCNGNNERVQPCNSQECPEYGPWESWNSCPVTCGGGVISRRRNCTNGEIGEKGCAVGGDREEQACNEQKCPTFSAWAAWGDCPATCGGPIQTTTRECVHGEEGQKGCEGPVIKSRKCSINECIGTFGKWEKWTTCSETCGVGIHSRTRECLHGTRCKGNSEQTENCEIKKCPVYGEWEEWQPCSKSCGIGERTRIRTCLHTSNPSDCVGEPEETERCNEGICPGQWTDWSKWSKCDVKCGTGSVKRTRDCQGGEIGKLGCDDGPAEETESCQLDPCPSKWADWQEWSRCSKTCDRGLRTRTRVCDGAEPGQGTCVPASASQQQEECNSVLCEKCEDYSRTDYCERYFSTQRDCRANERLAATYCPQSCNLCPALHETWQSWGPCSNTCGQGTRQRKRECKTEAEAGCEGRSSERERCEGPCRGFTDWSSWTSCSATCNEGVRTRERTCPFDSCQPDQDGSSSLTEEAECNMGECAGVWDGWGDWEACDTTCGQGNEIRSRKCLDGRVGGPGCPGSDTESRECTDFSLCQGKWTEWSDWSECSVACGTGTRERDRTCENGIEGQPDCIGLSTMSEECEGLCTAKWGDWGDWGECDSSCFRTRTRECQGGAQGDPGCRGKADSQQECDASTCSEIDECSRLSDFHIRCPSATSTDCLTARVQQACPQTCCEREKCADDVNFLDFCQQTACLDPRWNEYYPIYCKETCGYCNR